MGEHHYSPIDVAFAGYRNRTKKVIFPQRFDQCAFFIAFGGHIQIDDESMVRIVVGSVGELEKIATVILSEFQFHGFLLTHEQNTGPRKSRTSL